MRIWFDTEFIDLGNTVLPPRPATWPQMCFDVEQLRIFAGVQELPR